MVVYVASKAKHCVWWRALRSAGVPIVASWLDSKVNSGEIPEPTADHWRALWDKNIEEAAAADILLFVDLPDELQCGSLVEAGAALASGKSVFVVSHNFWSIEHHPNARKFSKLEDAIVAIMAWAKLPIKP
jgi:hypothetical protein